MKCGQRARVYVLILALLSLHAERTSAGSGEITDATLNTVRVFAQACSGEVCVSRDSVTYTGSFPLPGEIGFALAVYTIDGKCEVGVDPVTGQCRAFLLLDFPGESFRGPETVVRSEAEAFERCIPILDVLGLPRSVREYDIVRAGSGLIPSGGSELIMYTVSKEFEYDQMRAVGRCMLISVLEMTGEVTCVRYDPVVIPDRCAKARLSFGDARVKASSVLGSNKWTKNCCPVVDTKAPAVKAVAVKAEGSDAAGWCEKAYVCWEVPFAGVEDEMRFKGSIWLRWDTGELVKLDIWPGGTRSVGGSRE